MFYDRKIKYLDYLENGDKIRNAGFVKIEVMDQKCNIQVCINGLLPTDTMQREVWVGDGEQETEIGNIRLEGGRGTLTLRNLSSDELGKAPIPYKNIKEIRIPIAKSRELRCKWTEGNTDTQTQKRTSYTISVDQQNQIQEQIDNEKQEQTSTLTNTPNTDEVEYITFEQSPENQTQQNDDSHTTYQPGDDEETISWIEPLRGGNLEFIWPEEVTFKREQRVTQQQTYESTDSTHPTKDSERHPSTDRRDPSIYPTVKSHGPSIRSTTDRREPSIHSTTDHRDPSIHSTTDRREPSIRSTTDRRDPTIRSTTERYDSSIRQPTERRNTSIRTTAENSTLSIQPTKERRDSSIRPTTERSNTQMHPTTEQSESQTKSQLTSIHTETRSDEKCPLHIRLHEDKWKQLSQLYPHLAPFQDERNYLSIAPNDFVILQKDYHKLVNNSFLLHGFYNYEHLILTKENKRNTEQYYLGVPGNFYEKEKQVAVMYGFDNFECKQEPAQEGDFGYYMIPVEL
jgi:hypothetical protein